MWYIYHSSISKLVSSAVKCAQIIIEACTWVKIDNSPCILLMHLVLRIWVWAWAYTCFMHQDSSPSLCSTHTTGDRFTSPGENTTSNSSLESVASEWDDYVWCLKRCTVFNLSLLNMVSGWMGEWKGQWRGWHWRAVLPITYPLWVWWVKWWMSAWMCG